jgi:hypothetical protein
MIKGDKLLPHLCILVNNHHKETHRNAITDVMADLVGKHLGEPPDGFECKADQDQIHLATLLR